MKGKKVALALLVTFGLNLVAVTGVSHANSLNGVGEQQQTTQTQTTTTEPTRQENVEAVSGLFGGIGVDTEATTKASAYTYPFVKTANFLVALIVGITAASIFILTGLDLLYISVPPVRNMLFKQAPQGGGGFGAPQASSGGGMQLISDEAKSAVALLSGGGGGASASPMGGGFGGGGFGGGGFGGGGFGAPAQAEPPKMKNVLIDYLKKRTLFLVMFGVCVVLLTTTIFTDIGMVVGAFILDKLIAIFS